MAAANQIDGLDELLYKRMQEFQLQKEYAIEPNCNNWQMVFVLRFLYECGLDTDCDTLDAKHLTREIEKLL